ncbi:MAG: glycosyltransferase family 2 protein [Anaerolineales bacterium]|nr:glycosyltransferase family 2 protein [Anaerolineales bacterium]
MSPPRLSICIVSFQARECLRNCLNSVYANPPAGEFEVILVDNHSDDGTVELAQREFPDIRLIINPENRGFTAPMNQALRAGRGEYLLELNPDALVLPGAFDHLVDFMEKHPEVGICGPKVLNMDGSLQKPCRRGESRPWAVITYFTGLSNLFPRSKWFGGYLMSYIDEDETHEVAGVSGSCMLIRRQVIQQIGYLDERFFAYQEDADFCFQARKAGWKIFYVPAARIIHHGGKGGSHVRPFRSILEWHRSYWLHYRKNMARDYPFIFNWFYYLAIIIKLILALVLYLFRQGKFARNIKVT